MKQAIKYYFLKLISIPVAYDWIKSYYKKAQQRYNHERTEFVVTDGDSYRKEMILRVWAENLAYIDFENECFLTNQDKNAYLTHYYGDFMQLPPPEKRCGHSIQKIDFGRYQ